MDVAEPALRCPPLRQRRRSGSLGEIALGLLIVLLLAYIAQERGLVDLSSLTQPRPATTTTAPLAQGTTISRSFIRCPRSGGTCVIDGDTIRIDGQSIRIADIDTPEIRSHQCSEELALGQRATDRMLELVNAGPFTLEMWDHRDEDRYGRKLRVLKREGQSLGMILVAEGLARPWGGSRRPWC